jgi:hypothetical protein
MRASIGNRLESELPGKPFGASTEQSKVEID